MNINRPLMPGFLKKAEQKLLLNYPGIWSTRIHLVLYYGILFILALAGLCFLDPTPIKGYTNTEYWIGFISIISAIGFVVWLIYLLRFNVFKKYGNIHPLHGLLNFVIYFIATLVLILFNFVHPTVETIRANRAYKDEEIVKDINAINTKLLQLEYHLLRPSWKYDTITLKPAVIIPDSIPANDQTVAVDEAVEAPAGSARYNEHDRYQLDTVDFYQRMATTDSLIKINDTSFKAYETPRFVFLSVRESDDHTREKCLSSFELYNLVHNHQPTKEQRAVIGTELSTLLKKYEFPGEEKYYRSLEIDDDDTPYEIVEKRYRLYSVNSSLNNICEKKYRWYIWHTKDLVHFFYYLTLSLSLLLFIFRYSTVKTFFLSILAGVLLSIFTAMMLAFSRSNELTVFSWLIIYTIGFFIGALLAWRAKKRKAIIGIMINLFVVLIHFLPLLVLVWYYEYLRRDSFYEISPREVMDVDKYLIYAEVGGVVLLLTLMATFIHRAYRRWYASPED